MTHVFVSYTHEDEDFVADLVHHVEGAGIAVWVGGPKWRAGEDWHEEVDQAIRDAFALILVLTPEAVSSEYVAYEWALAMGLGKSLIPVLLRDAGLHPRLTRIPALDFREARPWDDLIRDLEALAMTQPLALFLTDEGVDPYALGEGAAGDTELVTDLLDDLRDGKKDTRLGAAARLGEVGDTFVIPALLEALDDSNPAVRAAVAGALGQIGDAAAVTGLLERLDDRHQEVRLSAIWALGVLKDPRAASELARVLDDPAVDLRRAAAEALGSLQGAEEVLPGLLDALHDPDEDVRKAAAWALGQVHDPAAVPGLLDALHGDDLSVRDIVAWSLGEIAGLVEDADLLADVAAGLTVALDDEASSVRTNAAWALGTIQAADAVPRLLEALLDEDTGVRWAAAEALEEIGEAAVPCLLEILDETADERREMAAGVLERIDIPEAQAAARAWREGQAAG
jgi:HEAT repeat protein